MLRGTEAWRGAGIPGCLKIVTGFSVLHISFQIKSSKFPQFLHLPTCDELQNIILCLLPPAAGVERVQRKALQESSHQRWKPRSSSNQIKIKHVELVLSWSICWGYSVLIRQQWRAETVKHPSLPRFNAESTCKQHSHTAPAKPYPSTSMQPHGVSTQVKRFRCLVRPRTDTPTHWDLHELCEVVHRGDQPLPLSSLIGGWRVLRDLGRGLCRSRRMHLQGKARSLVLGFFT